MYPVVSIKIAVIFKMIRNDTAVHVVPPYVEFPSVTKRSHACLLDIYKYVQAIVHPTQYV